MEPRVAMIYLANITINRHESQERSPEAWKSVANRVPGELLPS